MIGDSKPGIKRTEWGRRRVWKGWFVMLRLVKEV